MQETVQPLKIAGKEFNSRLFLGTGKFESNQTMAQAITAAKTQMVTVALKRVNLQQLEDSSADILAYIDPSQCLILPNTAGALTAEEAVRIARLAAAAGLPKWIKLEIHPEPNYLLPDPIETLKAAEILVQEGFTVLPYINADPVLALKLQDVGCAAVMPLGSPIGSKRGLDTRTQLAIIIEQARVPVVVDAGIGLPSHAAEAIELGADAVLVNTAIAIADNPPLMAQAFAMTIEAALLAKKSTQKPFTTSTQAQPTSPLTAFLDS